jgi:hypothetical protein
MPDLFAGFNADPIDGDEVDGAGTNWDIWPVLFDSYEGLVPLVITQEMVDAFDGCADIVFPHADNEIMFPAAQRVLTIRPEARELEIPGESDTLEAPAVNDDVVIRKAG